MIPKRAIFYWEGREASWLRGQSWESFGRLNPDWKIEIISRYGDEGPITGTSRMAIAQRSDLARYMALADRGGFYFDTDIVFFKPVPDAWLDVDVALPLSNNGCVTHIGMLGSSPKNQLFGMLVDTALKRIRVDPYPLGYQSLGVNLLHGWNVPSWCDVRAIKWLPLPPAAIIAVSWQSPEKTWGPVPQGHEWGPGAIGLHWYGNDHLSQELEPKATADTLRGTLIGKALCL